MPQTVKFIIILNTGGYYGDYLVIMDGSSNSFCWHPYQIIGSKFTMLFSIFNVRKLLESIGKKDDCRENLNEAINFFTR